MLFELAHPSGAKLPQVASPMRFMQAPLKHDVPPPLLGQHTLEILHGLGIENDEIERLRKTGII
jgi:crotonobetainyl-CoA:carnitine CoA-transferase CaiB-like acyl-CoA transferase